MSDYFDKASTDFAVESKLPMPVNVVVYDLIATQPARPLDRIITLLEGFRGPAFLDSTPQPTTSDAREYLQIHRIGPCINEWVVAALRARPQSLVTFSIQHFVRLRNERRWEPLRPSCDSGMLGSSTHKLPAKPRELPPRPVLRSGSMQPGDRNPLSSAPRSPAPASIADSDVSRSPSTSQLNEPVTRRRRSSTQISVSSAGSAALPMARRSSPLVARTPGPFLHAPSPTRSWGGSKSPEAATPEIRPLKAP